MEIEAPTNAYAFIDLTLVRFEGDTNGTPSAPTLASNQPAPEPTNAPPAVVEPQESTQSPTNQPVASVPETNLVATTSQPTETAPEKEEPAPTPVEEKPDSPLPSDPAGPTNAVATVVGDW